MKKECSTFIQCKKKLFIVCLCLVSISLVWAQQSVRGVVKDVTGEPLPGASIVEKSTTNGTITDANGRFSIQLNDPQSLLVVYFIGFVTRELVPQGEMEIVLQEDISYLEEVVVIGYGSVAKRDLTGSISTVKPKELTAFTVSDPIQALQGLVPGVQISQNTGDPAGDYSIRIRGVNSIQGNNAPLYIIDGIPSNTATISTYDIESLEVLKDASATAIYGSRGANGVVLITTKRGKTGKAIVSYDFEYGIQSQIKKFALMDAQEWARFYNQYLVNTGTLVTAPFSESDITAMGKGTDWQDLMYKDAPIVNHNINVTGGSDDIKYFISASAMLRDGLLQNSSYNKYNIRSSLDFVVSPMIDASLQLSYTSTENMNQSDGGGLGGSSMIHAIYSCPPLFYPFDDEGNYLDFRAITGAWMSHELRNPMNIAYESTYKTVTNMTNINASIEFKPVSGFSLKSVVGIQGSDARYDAYLTSKYIYSNSSASVSQTRSSSIVNENIIHYNFSIYDSHKFDIMGAFTYQEAASKSIGASGNTFFSDILYTYSIGSADNINTPSTGYSKWALMSYLGRINYSYNGKYMLTASFRADGSSRYSAGQRWGYFPSGAVAWRISDEPFMEGFKSLFLSDMKIRVGYGQTGSTAINPYSTQNLLYPGKTATGDGNKTYYAPSSVFPGNLKWETTSQWNIGLDVALIKNRVLITADYYEKLTTDLLNTVSLPTSSGYTSTMQNIGSMSNKGVELLIDAEIIRKRDFGFTAQMNIAHNKNKIEKLANGDDMYGTRFSWGTITIIRENEPLGAFYLYKDLGLDENGRLAYLDANEDGQFTDESDRYLAGSPFPVITYGLNCGFRYKNWDFNFFLQGSYGNNIFNFTETRNYLYSQGLNIERHVLEQSWKTGQDNTKAHYPRIESVGTLRFSDRFLEKGTYLRLKNIQLAYNIPCPKWRIDKWVQGIRIFVSAQDYLTFTKYKGIDPEVSSIGGDIDNSIDYLTYPNNKRVSFGLKVEF